MGTDAYLWLTAADGGRPLSGRNIALVWRGDIMWAGYKERVMDYMKVTGSVGEGTGSKSLTKRRHYYGKDQLVRIDNRLIHGQVCTQWLYHYKE